MADSSIERVKQALQHRGPDDHGVWCDPEARMTLIHQRLSVLDISAEGHQPMASRDGRYVVSYNGEIYNFRTLRVWIEKEGEYVWRGHSDTEVLVALIERCGVEKTLSMIDGMFAIAIWDRKYNQLHLVRDRMGEKPLYIGWLPNRCVAFASEINAIATMDGFTGRIDREAVCWLLKLGYIPAPYSIYEDIYKLPPASHLVLRTDDLDVSPDHSFLLNRSNSYWELNRRTGNAPELSGVATEAEMVEGLRDRLTKAVESRMVADVPLGAFLSGGIDSSLVVAIMQHISRRPVKTFCIGFSEQAFDESKSAAKVASYLNTDHETLLVTDKDALDLVPKLPEIYQEPFADSSQIPTYLLCQFARKQVTVALTGDGGDELFFGYGRYFQALKTWSVLGKIPKLSRDILAHCLLGLPQAFYDVLLRPVAMESAGFRVHRFASRLLGASAQDFHRMYRSHWFNAENVVLGQKVGHGMAPVAEARRQARLSVEEQMMMEDQLDYLPDDILVKVDRASMAVALETRVPLLSPDIVDFAWQVPVSLKYRNGKGKWLMRKLLSEFIPESLFDRPKQGFGVPMESWLRGGLREWAESLLSDAALTQSGVFCSEPIKRMWRQHLNGRDFSQPLWNVLMFQSWYFYQKRSALL